MIVPTKDRPEFINIFIQNLLNQPGEFDFFVADMNSSDSMLPDNWLTRKSLDRFSKQGHSYMMCRVHGHNQLFGYQKGLEFARENGYDLAVASDDDCVFELGWIERLKQDMIDHPDWAVAAGLTLLPWMSKEEQFAPEWFWDKDGYRGKLTECEYYHCTLIPPWTEPRTYEQIFGPFMFRVADFLKVGGFPTFLSPLGFRGEMWPMTACYFAGKKLGVDPKVISWHYSASHGGLKLISGADRDGFLKHDKTLWEEFVSKRMPRVERP